MDHSTQSQDKLTLTGSVALGTGVMIGAGIFALVGQVAELAGGWVPWAFLAGAVVVAFSSYSYIRYSATNPSSGAYGIPQSLPASKMASAGADWQTNPATQIAWGLGYIQGRYGSPCGAWAHSQAHNWY